MLIRTKLLALLLAPIPIVVLLSMYTALDARSFIQEAGRAADFVAYLRAEHDVRQLLLSQRDQEARTAIADSRGLEALLFDTAEATPASAAESENTQPKLDEALQVFTNERSRHRAEAIDPQADDLIRSISDLSPASQGGLLPVFSRFDPATRQFGDLSAAAAASSEDLRWSQTFLQLAALQRLQTAIAGERMVLRHALQTLTLSPDVQRKLVDVESRIDSQLRNMRRVNAAAELSAVTATALTQADDAGRRDLLAAVDDYTKRMDLLSQLREAAGFAGLIHHYKNYILRGDEADLVLLRADLLAVESILQSLESLRLSTAERNDLATVRDGFARYSQNVDLAQKLHVRNEPLSRIDEATAIRGDAIRDALQRLATFRPDISAQTWDSLSESLVQKLGQADRQSLESASTAALAARNARIWQVVIGFVLVALTVVLTLFAGLRVYQRISNGIDTLVKEFRRVATTGDVQPRSVVTGHDELAGLNESVVEIGRRLSLAADRLDAMARGDYEGELPVLGEQDRLGHAMQRLAISASEVIDQARHVAAGRYEMQITRRSSADTLAIALNAMGDSLRSFAQETQSRRWLNEAQIAVFDALRSAETPQAVASAAIATVIDRSGAVIGAVYWLDDDRRSAQPLATLGMPESFDIATRFAPRQGLFGLALESPTTRVFDSLPPGFLRLSAAVGSSDLPAVSATPLRVSGQPVGALELGWLGTPGVDKLQLLDSIAESIALALSAAETRARNAALLTQTQRQSEKLQTQQEELRASNEELEEQTQLLRQSEEELKAQREELQASNEELIEKTRLLERQRAQLEHGTRELEQATRYKSEFLSNMSHELRTPLNSLLILSKMLAANDEGNLTPQQVQSARVIHEGGRDLLRLINDILDLSKVEAGRLDLVVERFRLQTIVGNLERQFRPVAEDRGLELTLEIDASAPSQMHSDSARIEQILRNLIGNALKFTERGSVRLRIARTAPDLSLKVVHNRHESLSFSVSDTGPGIPDDKLSLIFEAFRQADGSTSRRYGGTGLGLTISRSLAQLLGGEIVARSSVGNGSEFTLVLPEHIDATAAQAEPPKQVDVSPAPGNPEQPTPAPVAAAAQAGMEIEPGPIEDDRFGSRDNRCVLIVEDDLRFAALVRDAVRKRGYRAVVAGDGLSAVRMARMLQPSAVILDLRLPDMDGREVLQSLKWSPNTRHIPVHIVTAADNARDTLERGAIGILSKPATPEALSQVIDRIDATLQQRKRRVLVVEDDRGNQAAIHVALTNDQTEVVAAGTAAEALNLIQSDGTYDCIVLDLTLPDSSGIELLERLNHIEGLALPPAVIYTGRDLSPAEHRQLSELAQSIVLKGADSEERLVDEVMLFLHAVEKDLPEEQRRKVRQLHGDDVLRGRKILLVDDDLRNSFALSGALRKRGLDVLIADNGQMALEMVAQHGDIQTVLMDVMMPVMDGLEATRRIRADARNKRLPIIALTAKAMAEDRRQCIEAGASDYISKPVDVDHLVSVLRVWLSSAL